MASSVSNDFETFAGEMAPTEAPVQSIPCEEAFLDSLESFVSGGMQNGDGIVVIAAQEHLTELYRRMVSRGFNIDAARARQQYFALDASESLNKITVDGVPDAALFDSFVGDLMARAGRNGRSVRAFSDMVARLRSQGRHAAIEQLEKLWHGICHQQGLAVFAFA